MNDCDDCDDELVYTNRTNPYLLQCEFHVHIRRLKLSDLPKDDVKLKQMLFQWFADKDKLLDQFSTMSSFKGAKKLKPLPPSEWIPAMSLMVGLGSLFGHFCLHGLHFS